MNLVERFKRDFPQELEWDDHICPKRIIDWLERIQREYAEEECKGLDLPDPEARR